MKSVIAIIFGAVFVSGIWFFTVDDRGESQPDLTGKSSDPHSPQQVGVTPQVIDPKGPAPSLFVTAENSVRKRQHTLDGQEPKGAMNQGQRAQIPSTPKAINSSGEVNPDAVSYYRKRGLLGASKDALAVLKSQTDMWRESGEGGLNFEQVGGGLNLNFETDQEGNINGAVVEIDGGGAGARLMSIEMWMTGMENTWDLYWETQQPGSLAGTIPTPSGQELHYFCDMTSMDESGSLNQPSRCHFVLNQPTPEYLNYKQQADAPPLQKARSRLEP